MNGLLLVLCISEEKEEKQAEEKAGEEDEPELFHLSVPKVLQWLTGQGHKPLLQSELQAFKVIVKFDHQCQVRMPGHTICYPTVSACSNTVTFPVAHLNTYDAFKTIMVQALKSGGGFNRV